MGHSHALRIRDVRAIDRLVGECGENWLDRQAWQSHLLEGATRLVNFPVALHCEVARFDRGQDTTLHYAQEFGWPSERDRRLFAARTQQAGKKLFSLSLMDIRFRDRFTGRSALTLQRADLVSDHDWHRSPAYDLAYRPTGMNEMLFSAVRLTARSSVSVMAFGTSERRNTGRHRGVLALLHREIAARLGTRLSTDRERGLHQLPPQQRRVLDLLMRGLDEKSIASELFRTRSTINGHIAAIYRSFGVSSRPELMACVMKRIPVSKS